VMDAEYVATINSATSKYLAKLRNTTLDEWIALIEKATRQ